MPFTNLHQTASTRTLADSATRVDRFSNYAPTIQKASKWSKNMNMSSALSEWMWVGWLREYGFGDLDGFGLGVILAES